MYSKQVNRYLGTSRLYTYYNIIEQRGVYNNIINNIIIFGPTTKLSNKVS